MSMNGRGAELCDKKIKNDGQHHGTESSEMGSLALVEE